MRSVWAFMPDRFSKSLMVYRFFTSLFNEVTLKLNKSFVSIGKYVIKVLELACEADFRNIVFREFSRAQRWL